MHDATQTRPDATTDFPVDFDGARGAFRMLPMTAARIADAAFLDQRLGGDWNAADILDWRAVRADALPRPALLFHTAFCASTLLARALQDPPRVVSLKEPQVLTRLCAAALHVDAAQIDGPLRAALQLLSRPWSADGRCIVKPTNQANSLLHAILEATTGHALLLHSSLEDFVVSCCRKLPEADRRIRWMAQHLIKDTHLQRALDVPWDHPFHFVESCVLTWHAQIERYADALAADAPDRLRTLDMRVLLADPQRSVAACVDWLELGTPAATVRERVDVEFHRNAKHPDRAYDPARREQDRATAVAQYADVIEAALAWSRDVVAPLARHPADWKPLAVPANG